MNSVETTSCNSLNDAIDCLSKVMPLEKLESSLDRLVDKLSLSTEDASNMEQLRNDLEKQFDKKITIFGSVASRLAFKGADLDLWLDLGVNPTLDGWEENREQIANMVHERICKKDNITKVRYIHSPRVPVVKFTDTRFNIEGDLSFKTRLSVYNSELLRAYCDSDPLVHKFLMLLKLWGKSNNLISIRDLSSYDFSLMGSVILMQKDIGLIKPLSEMRLGGKQIPIEGWNCFFDPAQAKGQPKKYLSTMDLFIKFFKFYADMDYASYTISPFLGQLVRTEDLVANKNLEINQQLIGVNSNGPITPCTICLQDPFDMYFNTAHLVKPLYLKRFVGACKEALAVAERISRNEAPFCGLIPLETLKSL